MASGRSFSAARALFGRFHPIGEYAALSHHSRLQQTKIAACCRCYSMADEAPRYNYEISRDPAEWRYVERLLPNSRIPEPAVAEQCPTPSGWVPPRGDLYKDLPYRVERTKNHMLPVYIDEPRGETRKFVKVKNIRGDIWALDRDLREYLETVFAKQDVQVLTQVSEPGRWLRVRGNHADQVSQFLIDRGF